MWFRLFPFFLLVVYAFAQADDTITLTTIKLVDFDPLETVTFKFDWKSEAGHHKSRLTSFRQLTSPTQLNNATLELISGRAEDKGTDVMDIIAVNVSTVDGTNAIHYKLHPGTPGGPYHARMSGTIFNGRTSLSSTTSALSNTFTVTTSSLPCAVGTWTPVRSLTDPTYSPVRLTVVTFDGELFSAPKTVFTHADISGPKAGISFSLDRVNFLFDFAEHNISVEVLNTVTGFNGGPQYLGEI
ncbi:hypothetical protein B0H13DRAFT_2112828 [Mycena leptocephala]|nr:hypothetical protein B0H13DRAFT_2112828 [Mycena leptocephala]